MMTGGNSTLVKFQSTNASEYSLHLCGGHRSRLCDTMDAVGDGIDLVEMHEKTVAGVVNFIASVTFATVPIKSATASFEKLLWIAKMGFTKFEAASTCQTDKTLSSDAIQARALQSVDSCLPSSGKEGQFFTTTPPKLHNEADLPSCVPYPTEEASFCSRLGHSHEVDRAFTDKNYGALRNANVELVWSNFKHQDIFKKLSEVSSVCQYSIQDSLCLEAFPLCTKTDITPCTMACRNIMLCFGEIFFKGKGAEQSAQVEKSLSKYVDKCHKMCSEGAGLNRVIDWTGLAQEEFEADMAFAFPQQGSHVKMFGFFSFALGSFVLFSFITIVCHRAGRVIDYEQMISNDVDQRMMQRVTYEEEVDEDVEVL